MNRLALTIAFAVMLLLAACAEAEKSPATQTQAANPAETATAADSETNQTAAGSAEEATLAGSNITLGSGEEVKVISVGYFDENMKSLDGLVAIEGRVKESHPDRGALILIDCSVEAGCTDGCCPEAEVPVRLDTANYSGELPSADKDVVVIGDIKVTEMGYELAVREIREGDQTVLELKI